MRSANTEDGGRTGYEVIQPTWLHVWLHLLDIEDTRTQDRQWTRHMPR